MTAFDDIADLMSDAYDIPTYESNTVYEINDSANSVLTRVPASDPADIAQFLVDLGIIPILKEDFFLRSNPINHRSLLDYPEFIRRKYSCAPYHVGAHLFYNQMTRMYFTRQSDNFSSYLAIQAQGLLTALGLALDEAPDLFPDFGTDPLDILPLFKNATVQERRLGAMFHIFRRYKRAVLQVWFPLYWLERNYFLTEDEIEEIENVLEGSTQESAEKFQSEHLIADSIGFGDTRIMLDWKIGSSDIWKTRVGALATIPTAFAIDKGLLGSTYTLQQPPPPELNFTELVNLFNNDEQAQAVPIIQNYLLTVLDNLSAMVLQEPLGNRGHFGLGAFMRTSGKLSDWVPRPWAEHIALRSFISLEYLCPARERRSFIDANDELLFAALGLDRSNTEINDQLASDPLYATTILAFFEERFATRLFNYNVRARVSPNVIFRWSSAAHYESTTWGWDLGTDTYVAGRERITRIKAPSAILKRISVKRATRPVAYQYKIFGSLFYKIAHDDHSDINWLLSLNFDTTVVNSGIGRDYMVTFNVEAHF